MIKIVICDDDINDREQLRQLVSKCGDALSLETDIKEYESGEAFLEDGYSPELLFLDIVMEQKDGIEVGAEIRRRCVDTIIIYVTNISEKMAEAINRIHSYGYLMKPAKEQEVARILQEASAVIKRNLRMNYETFLSEKNGIVTVQVKDIYYFEYRNRRVRLVTKEEIYILKEKIGDIAERMNRYNFEMSHQSFVVNLYEVGEIKGPTLKMQNGDKVCLAQKRAATIRKRMMELIKDSIHSQIE